MAAPGRWVDAVYALVHVVVRLNIIYGRSSVSRAVGFKLNKGKGMREKSGHGEKSFWSASATKVSR